MGNKLTFGDYFAPQADAPDDPAGEKEAAARQPSGLARLFTETEPSTPIWEALRGSTYDEIRRRLTELAEMLGEDPEKIDAGDEAAFKRLLIRLMGGVPHGPGRPEQVSRNLDQLRAFWRVVILKRHGVPGIYRQLALQEGKAQVSGGPGLSSRTNALNQAYGRMKREYGWRDEDIPDELLSLEFVAGLSEDEFDAKLMALSPTGQKSR